MPGELFARVDARAKALPISRNRFVTGALTRALAEQPEWSPAFLEALDSLQPLDAADELLESIETRRTRKAPIEL